MEASQVQTFKSSDFHEFAKLISNGEIENIQISKGDFNGVLQVVMTPNLIVSMFSQNRAIFQKGHSASGYFSFLIWDPSASFNWRNVQLKRGMMPVLLGIEHVALIGEDFIGYPISIREEFFVEYCKARGFGHLPKLFMVIWPSLEKHKT